MPDQIVRDRAVGHAMPGLSSERWIARALRFLRTRPSAPQPAAVPAAERPLVLLAETGHRPAPAPGPDAPLVSVVVVSFNYGAHVAAAVASVLAQTFADLEVIVVEGGSPDPAQRAAVAVLAGPRVRVLMQDRPHGNGANRNAGISQARGRYVCCLDADDTFAPTFLEKAVYLLERHGYDVVASALEMCGDDSGVIGIMEQPDLAAQLEANHVLTCAVFRRDLWVVAGGFRDVDRTATGYVFEDWAFWIRLAALGARFRNLPADPMLRYRVHAASLSRGADVLPMWRQRQLVREMNIDLLDGPPDPVAASRRTRPRGVVTPLGWPAPIISPPGDADGRVLLLAMPFLTLGGADRLLSAVVADLVGRGWRVVVVTTQQPGPEAGDTTAWFESHTKDVFHLPRCLPGAMWEDFLHHLVASRGVGVVWVVGSAAAYDCLRGLKAAHPALGVADMLFNTVGHVDNNRRRRACIDVTFVESRMVADHLVGRGETPGRITVMPGGIDLVAWQPRPPAPALLARIGAAANDLVVGFCGRWSPEKNPLGFVEIARLCAGVPDLRFVMTGTGQLRAGLELAIDAAGFPAGRFHLLGEVDDLAGTLGTCGLLVLPSALDGRPMVVMEALAMGVPVLASRVGALPELVEHGVTGWLCAPQDLAGFAARIARAAADRPALRAMSGRARAHAERHFDSRIMLAAYRARLAALLPAGRRG